MDEWSSELVPRPETVPALGQPPGSPREVHVHHHYAPAVTDTSPVRQGPPPNALDKYLPAIVVWVLIILSLGILAVVGVLLTPLILAMMGALATIMIGFAVCVGSVALLGLAVSAALRNVRMQGDAPKKGRKR